MIAHDLNAAGITDPSLRASYSACRSLHAAHGRTYYLATLLLPPAARPAVWSLYGFARMTDDLVDHDHPLSTVEVERAAKVIVSLEEWVEQPDAADVVGLTTSAAAILPAVRHTLDTYGIDRALITAFLASMRMDLTVTDYETYADLERYMYGSAAVIGLQMLPVMGHPSVPERIVAPYAIDLGIAFQLTNFVRDVGEDLRRGRVYLPAEELALFGVDRDHLARGVVDGDLRRALAHQIARIRELYRSARVGIRLLDPSARECIGTATRLYEGILDEVERSDYRVLDQRAQVSIARRARLAGGAFSRVAYARSSSRLSSAGVRSIPRRPQ